MAPFCVFYLFTSFTLFYPYLVYFSSLPIKMRVVSQTSLYFCIH